MPHFILAWEKKDILDHENILKVVICHSQGEMRFFLDH